MEPVQRTVRLLPVQPVMVPVNRELFRDRVSSEWFPLPHAGHATGRELLQRRHARPATELEINL